REHQRQGDGRQQGGQQLDEQVYGHGQHSVLAQAKLSERQVLPREHPRPGAVQRHADHGQSRERQKHRFAGQNRVPVKQRVDREIPEKLQVSADRAQQIEQEKGDRNAAPERERVPGQIEHAGKQERYAAGGKQKQKQSQVHEQKVRKIHLDVALEEPEGHKAYRRDTRAHERR